MSRDMATYVYCVVANTRAKRGAKKPPKGLPGARALRRLDVADGYEAVVASVPLALYSAEVIEPKLRDLDWVGEVAAAHEAVIEHTAGSATVVPMKLFTLFSSDERAVEHVRRTKRTLDRVVRRIDGCREWGLRILLDERARPKAPLEAPTSGTGFLLAKSELRAAGQKQLASAEATIAELYDALERAAKGAVRRPPPTRELAGRVLLDAAFLVPEAGTKAFQKTVARTAEGLAVDGFHVSLTGPWPAYSFVEGR